MCVTAGIIVGIFNFSIFQVVVYRFLQEMRSKINEFREKLNKYYGDRTLQCLSAECHLDLVYQTHDVSIVTLLSRTPFRKDFQSLERQNIISEATPFFYNAILMKRLELLAPIDELTGVLNCCFSMRRMKEELERSKRHALTLSVGMIDIDDFKNINDTYDH